MAFCRLVLPFLVLTVVSAYANVQVPVFIWGDLKKFVKSKPLSTVDEDVFKDILSAELQEDPFTVIFIDESLSVEDFSLKNLNGDTAFPYLQENVGKSVYLPAVEDPTAALDSLADSEKVDHVKLTENGLSAEFEPNSVKILFITLKDAREGESRADMLRRHNDFMQEMFTKLQNDYEHVVAVYTAKNPSWTVSDSHKRVRRQAESNVTEDVLDGLKLYAGRIVLTVGTAETNFTQLDSSSSVINDTVMSTTMTYGADTVILNFLKKSGYWFFSSVTVQQGSSASVHLVPDSEIFAPMGFSYRCGHNVTFGTSGNESHYTLLYQNLKVQPYFVENGNQSLVFGDSVNCVGFFSVPIWSGLFVVFIMLAITFYGIMMMMDIRTMDRFDDPKGKTITINATD